MRLRLLLIPFALLAISHALVACGDDDDDDAGDNGADVPADTTDVPDEGGDDGDDNGGGADSPFSEGSATLTIGDESWEFDGIFCAFSTEESRNDNVPFTLTGFTESDTGARLQLDASVVDLSEPVEISAEDLSVTLDDVDDFDNPSVNWGLNSTEVFGGSVPAFQIDGKNVTVEGVFDNDLTEPDFEAIPGTLVASCP